jgi:hypothetical protein
MILGKNRLSDHSRFFIEWIIRQDESLKRRGAGAHFYRNIALSVAVSAAPEVSELTSKRGCATEVDPWLN